VSSPRSKPDPLHDGASETTKSPSPETGPGDLLTFPEAAERFLVKGEDRQAAFALVAATKEDRHALEQVIEMASFVAAAAMAVVETLIDKGLVTREEFQDVLKRYEDDEDEEADPPGTGAVPEEG